MTPPFEKYDELNYREYGQMINKKGRLRNTGIDLSVVMVGMRRFELPAP
jgi:hypothetical protein